MTDLNDYVQNKFSKELELMISNLSDVVLLITRNFVVFGCNSSAENYLNIKAEFLKNIDYAELYDKCKNDKIEMPNIESYKNMQTTKHIKHSVISWEIQNVNELFNGYLLIGKIDNEQTLNKQSQENLDFLKMQATEITGQDIHQAKTLQDYMRNIRSYYNKIIGCMPNNVYWLDRNCITLGCNDNVLKFVGLTKQEEFIGIDYETMGKLAKWEDGIAESFKRDDLAVMKTGIPIIGKEEPPIKERDGKTSYYMSSRVPIKDDSGKVIGIVGISVDITERKRAEQAETERKVFQEKLKVSQNLAGVMAHELRTPLASYKLILDLIKAHVLNSTMDMEEKCSHILNFIEKGDNVDKSSRDLIDMILFKIRSMNNKLDHSRFQLCFIKENIDEVLNNYPFETGERDLIFFNSADSFIYKGDKLATGHVLSNLIRNTLKIIKEEGKGKIKISFDQSDESYNKLIFEDNAKGIDEKFLPNMFDSFVYKDSTGKGTGLGLSFCKMVMNEYDGNIICESELGKYTRFTCLFPKVDMSELDFA